MSEASRDTAALRAGGAQPRICARTAARRRSTSSLRSTRGALELSRRRSPRALRAPLLNALMALGREARAERRRRGRGASSDAARFAPPAGAEPVLPFAVADYVDFFASRHHAAELRADAAPRRRSADAQLGVDAGRLPRPLRHGRRQRHAGAPPARPGLRRRRAGRTTGRALGSTSRSSWASWSARRRDEGEPVDVGHAEGHIFGLVALNDWSARDIQAWESQPLGPHLGKSFATSISGWVVPWEAVAAGRAGRAGAQRRCRTCATRPAAGIDVDVELRINGQLVSSSSALQLAWTPAQLVAHLTANGAHLRTGDLLGTGTISGPEPESRGCLLERTWAGQEPLTLADGSVRTWLEDGDEVTIAAGSPGDPLAQVSGRVLPAL